LTARPAPRSTRFPYTTLFRSRRVRVPFGPRELVGVVAAIGPPAADAPELRAIIERLDQAPLLHGELLASLRWLARYTHAPLGEVDRKSTRLNSSHVKISYAVC